jgi:hypothetical protein
LVTQADVPLDWTAATTVTTAQFTTTSGSHQPQSGRGHLGVVELVDLALQNQKQKPTTNNQQPTKTMPQL